MTSLEEFNFRLKVTQVRRNSINALIDFTESYKEVSRLELSESLDQENIDVSAFHSLYIDTPEIEFSLYALAVIHCYSILENNRKLILLRLEGISERQRESLYDTRVVKQCLEKSGIEHEKIKCFKSMDEFRLVNNAIKHNRLGLSKSIETDHGVKYGAKQLRSLYINRARYLETYLSDLYERTKA